MDPHIEDELTYIKRKVEENNRILKKIQSSYRWTMIIGVVKWVVYIGILVGIYSVIQPYINQMMETYSSIQESAGVMADIRANGMNFESLKELFR